MVYIDERWTHWDLDQKFTVFLIFLNETCFRKIQISTKFLPQGPIDNKPY